jgi:hypothetical protein
MKTLSHKQFVELLEKKKGTSILGIIAETEPKMRKTNNPFKEVKKISHLTVVTGANYTRAVEKQGGEGFVADPLPYGKFVVKDKVVESPSGELQLRTVFRNAPKPVSVKFIADGKEVTKEDVKPFLVGKKPSSIENALSILAPLPSVKQLRYKVQPDRQVKVRNYGFSNIREVHVNGEKYQLVS